MSNPRGIFDSYPGQPPAPSPFAVVPDQAPQSPFAVAPESAPASPFAAAYDAPAASPFAPVTRIESPFAGADDNAVHRPLEPGKPARLPEKRKAESPFQMVDAKEGFGLEPAAPVPQFAPSPFEMAPASSPFAAAPSQPAAVQASPFAFETAPSPAPAPTAWQQPAAQPVFQAAPVSSPIHASAGSYTPTSPGQSDSSSIRQLELRAIFGVDREMSADEILQRARALPGIRHIARVTSHDIGAIDGLKQIISNLGFGGGGLRVFAGSVPIEFIREGNVMLAVQTDGGFAPGVRETLMIVGRELGRTA
jgi:hypothetical protein